MSELQRVLDEHADTLRAARAIASLGGKRDDPLVAMACALVDVDDAMQSTVLVHEGWWHPNTNAGRVHDHPEEPGRSWSIAPHRLCEPLYSVRDHV